VPLVLSLVFRVKCGSLAILSLLASCFCVLFKRYPAIKAD
jgi:hypothetical protein